MNGFHIGDNVTMSGNHNVGKVVGPPALLSTAWGTTDRPEPNVVWNEPFVFINYRSADTKAAADIEAELTRRLGHGAVFRDARMRAGTEFPKELMKRACTCKVMVSVIGTRWDDANGLRLLGNRADWVRREIVTALAHRVQVVPVLVGARGTLVAHDLPADIRAIADLQSPHLRRGYDEEDVRRLVDELVRDLPALAEAMSLVTGS